MMNSKHKKWTLITGAIILIAGSAYLMSNNKKSMEGKTVSEIHDTIQSSEFPELTGYWEPEDEVAYIELNKDKSICCVAHNQIYIYTSFKKETAEKVYSMYYDSIADLGRGGLRLNWDSFSLDIPIARIQLVNDSTAYIKWIGFYDKSKREYVFKESDFNSCNHVDSVLLRKNKV